MRAPSPCPFSPASTKSTPAAHQTTAEIDALVAQIYDLTEDEYTHILSTFPLVDEAVKAETRNTYRELLSSGKLPS